MDKKRRLKNERIGKLMKFYEKQIEKKEGNEEIKGEKHEKRIKIKEVKRKCYKCVCSDTLILYGSFNIRRYIWHL